MPIKMIQKTYRMRFLNPYPVNADDVFRYYQTNDESAFNFMWQQCQIQQLKPEVIQ